MPDELQRRHRNHLLASLRPDAYQRLAGKLRPVTVKAQEILYHAEQPIDAVYFPETAVICQMTLMRNGDTLETATVGVEGASWVSARIGAMSMPCQTLVAVGGEASVLPIAALDQEMQDNDHFRDLLTQYSHALLIHSVRLTGCTGLHSVEQRCARWLLTAFDRVLHGRLSVTQEFLAMLLGCSRPSINIVLHQFHERGYLKTEPGRVIVANREGLLTVVCDCYDVIKQHYAQVGQEP